LLPPSRIAVEPPALPERAIELELLRASELRSAPRSAPWLECWSPLFEPARPLSADLLLDAVVVLWVEKKCWFCDTLRVVDAAAGRPLAEKLSRLGLTGSLPVEKRAF